MDIYPFLLVVQGIIDRTGLIFGPLIMLLESTDELQLMRRDRIGASVVNAGDGLIHKKLIFVDISLQIDDILLFIVVRTGYGAFFVN